MENWSFGKENILRRSQKPIDSPLKLLFVGGDFKRKGGYVLLDAFKRELHLFSTLDIVTKEEGVEKLVESIPGIKIHRGLTANSPQLKELYANADLFVFPTLGDCLPIAVMEAMAAGLPIITTNVGALREEVEDGVNGIVVPSHSSDDIIKAVVNISHQSEKQVEMAHQSRKMAEERFDARRNYGKIFEMLRSV